MDFPNFDDWLAQQIHQLIAVGKTNYCSDKQCHYDACYHHPKVFKVFQKRLFGIVVRLIAKLEDFFEKKHQERRLESESSLCKFYYENASHQCKVPQCSLRPGIRGKKWQACGPQISQGHRSALCFAHGECLAKEESRVSDAPQWRVRARDQSMR